MWGSFFIRIFSALTACAVIAGCASAPSAPAAADASVGAIRLDDYKLGPADSVRIIVYQEPDLSGEFSISPKGEISYPLLGDIKAADLTVQELRDVIAKRLAGGYLNDARVAAEVVAYRPFYILGEVGAPGQYPYSAEMTVMKAVAAAGGFSYRANKSAVFIKRAHLDQEFKFDLTQDLLVFPGDIVRVGERFF